MALTGIDVRDRRVVIFDFDGTLADTVGGITRTARTVLLRHGFTDETLGDLTRLVGPPFPQAYMQVYGLSLEEAEQVTDEYRVIYKDLGIEGWPLYPGIEQLLRDLRAAGRLLAVASSKRSELVERATADEGIHDIFHRIEGKEDDLHGTKQETIARTLADFDATADEAVMVGDRYYDIEAAAANGVPTVGVRYGRTCERAELEDAGACAVAETVDELRALLLP